MHYAVLQKILTIPPVESLKRAFRAVKFLTAVDAHSLANDAFGVLVKRLTNERAFALQTALRAEGIETDVVEERLLPALPQTKFVQRLDCTAEGLMVYDPLNRSFQLEWKHLTLIAAGSVRVTEFIVQRTSRPLPAWRDPERPPNFETVTETSHREEQNDHLLLELIVGRNAQRFSATADRFNFSYLAGRRTSEISANFVLLVQDLVKSAPHAVINQGAYYLRENAPEIFAYPSKNAFFEEITWLLWQRAQMPA